MRNLFKTNGKLIQFLVISILFLSGCESTDPGKEDTPELITKVTLTFTPVGGGTAVIATASDPDGEGVKDIQVDGAINLSAGTTYTLSVSLINELAEVSSPEYNITDEVEEEGDEHMFFYAWTNGLFSDPAGDGNVDNRSDPINYEDEDSSGLPIGISTRWMTGLSATGTFRIILKHQPELKTGLSNAESGETDLDIVFTVIIN